MPKPCTKDAKSNPTRAVREGLTKVSDNLPARFFNEPLPETGKVITENELDRMLSDYYAERNWEEKGLIG